MDIISNIVKRLRENKLQEERLNYSEMDHDDLISLAQDKDQKAFEELLKQYSNLINKVSRKFFLDTGSGDEEDIHQVASLAFWDAVKSYNPEDYNKGFGSFASMVMQRKLSDLIRKEDADVRKLNNLAGSLNDPVGSDDEGGESTVGDNISNNVSAEDEYLGRDGAKKIIDFLEKNLSEVERDVIKRYIAGYKVSEISEETGMKYKSVENAIMRVKNKLAEYMRNSYEESKRVTEADLEFSDEEKQILNRALTRIDRKSKIREALYVNRSREYENYTEEQLDKVLDKIEARLKEMESEIVDINYDERDDILEEADNLSDQLFYMEEYLNDKQYNRSDEIGYSLRNLDKIAYEGESKSIDPYEERGLHRSMFR